jgi:hypothetical protein
MTRARAIVVVSLALVTAGVAVALAARLGESGKESLLPPEAAWLPPDAAFVMGVDVARVTASPLYQRIIKNSPKPPEVWKEGYLAGIDPARDVQQVVLAGDGKPDGAGVAIVLGRFESKKLEGALAATAGVSKLEYQGRTVFVTKGEKPGAKDTAISILGEGALIAGPVSSVTAAFDRRKRKTPGLPSKLSLVSLVQQVHPGSVFWMCGDQSLLSAATNMAPGVGSWTFPSLKTIVLSGNVDPDLSATIVGETADEKTAKELSEMMQGLLALFSMQGSRQPGLADFASAFQITHEGTRVRVAARLSYDTIEKLQPRPRPVPRPVEPIGVTP